MPYPPLRTGSRSEADSAKDRTTAPVAGSICTRVAGSLSIRHKRFRLGSNVRSSVLSLNAWGEKVAPGTRVPSVLRLLSSATEEAADTGLLNQRFVPSKATPVIAVFWTSISKLPPRSIANTENPAAESENRSLPHQSAAVPGGMIPPMGLLLSPTGG